jgi:alanine-glyoxylate transaminase / serine-glyoxylate transaminase / serine-pyruvate transaminase
MVHRDGSRSVPAGPPMDEIVLYTPGPTPIHPRAAAALGWPMRGHMDDDVFVQNDAIVADLRLLYGTAPAAFASLLSGTGTLGMEAGLANLLEPGDRVVIASNGVFGDRMVEMARRLGGDVHVVRAESGDPLDPAAVRRACRALRPAVLAFVHGETSTGVVNPVEELAAIGVDEGALVSVDAVTTVGMGPFEMAGWGIDYAYTGSQKCLSAPPGLAPIAVSERAMARIAARRTPVVTWYADLLGMQGYWRDDGAGRRYHHTVPIHLHWATGEAIRVALEEGLDARAERAKRVGDAVLAALETVGFSAAVAQAWRLPTVLTVLLPDGVDDTALRATLRREERLSVTGGLGPTAGLVWRLGLMGEAAHAEHYRPLMRALAGRLRAPHLPAAFEAALHDAGVSAAADPTSATSATSVPAAAPSPA